MLDERVLPSTGRVQREGEHPGRRAQGHRERDRPAHREPRDVRRLEPERVHHLERVGGHVLHRVPGGRDLAPSDPAVVEGEAAEMLAVDRDLLGPEAVVQAVPHQQDSQYSDLGRVGSETRASLFY